MDAELVQLDTGAAQAALDDLTALLCDAVAGGASVGFLPPLAPEAAEAWWRRAVFPRLAEPGRVLLGARLGSRLVGTVQLQPAQFPNGRHRAEVVKLLVHSASRRRGLASALMAELEAVALAGDRNLLVLDTLTGSPAEDLYVKLGWQVSGIIPGYCRVEGGGLGSTTIMFKHLDVAA